MKPAKENAVTKKPTIIYTHTDEAPALATLSFFPVVEAFCGAADVGLETRDISLAARILAVFSSVLPKDKAVPDALAELGALAKTKEANIIKLPNISASVPQLKAAIAELQGKGYPLPDYPEEPSTEDEKKAKSKYDKVKGSAVNPVLREGNSDRRAPKAVKEYARKNPHSMGAWSKDSKTHVATMESGDFRTTEKTAVLPKQTSVTIELVKKDGKKTVLRESLALAAGEIIDASTMRKKDLLAFLQAQIVDAQKQGLLFSLHMKATMMKVSDPIIFGHAVRVYFAELFKKHGASIEKVGFEENNGFGDLLCKLDALPKEERETLKSEISELLGKGAGLAMVDSDKGITNLHVPSDVIIDASMPAMIRTSGKMWNRDGELQDTKAVIPDSSYAGIYQEVFDSCKRDGAFDPVTMGSVSNVGLMAQKAEEYGSHDKTFEIEADGVVRVVDGDGEVLIEHDVSQGDLWRMCQTKDAPVRDWVKLAVGRAKATGVPAIFWLDEKRPHDSALIEKVKETLEKCDAKGLDIRILSPVLATRATLERVRKGEDTVSVTGNVLRDYLTDLFPILELGTSAKMLSIVPLMQGGGLFETGAGGSAPKHVQQFQKEGHLRWDSLGEFLALAVSLDHLAEKYQNPRARVLGEALDLATTSYLLNGKSPSRKAGELDNRGTHFYLAMYWAEELAKQTADKALQEKFAKVASELKESEASVLKELGETEGKPVDLGGYYWIDKERAVRAMRPSATFNKIIAAT